MKNKKGGYSTVTLTRSKPVPNMHLLGAPTWSRTTDLRLIRSSLSPTELQGHFDYRKVSGGLSPPHHSSI